MVERKTARRILILCTVVYGAGLFHSFMAAIFSPMLAAGGTGFGTLLMVYSMTALPVVIVLSVIIAWTLFATKRHRGALAVIALPILNLFLILVGTAGPR